MDITPYLIGGFASIGATLFTNPLEVIKTRYQLQGELAAKGTHTEPYRGIIQAFVTVARNDGYAALQKGLAPALGFQFIMNFCRLGIYAQAEKRGWTSNRNDGKASYLKGLFWGATGGICGSIASSPFYLVKTQQQAQAVANIAVGYQHKHHGMMNAFREIYASNGIRGLWRGALATVPRSALGSGAQMATFGWTKDFLRRNGWVTNRVLNSFTAGALAGTVMALAITPPDVIVTRLYNQELDEKGRGRYYRGVTDCLIKILKHEGIAGLYKGYWLNYLRLGPHVTLVLLFFDEIMATKAKYWDNVPDSS